ncbi:hypothetical protein CHU98_g8518 [Xylaria longipes]|nr:hypothetical protein CHU98_g8518 [Xylaria longipes]
MAYWTQSSASSNRPHTSTPSRPLVFIVELGLNALYPLTSSYNPDKERTVFLEHVRMAVWSAGIPECTIKKKLDNDFRTWCITENRDDKYGFDIVSPKLLYDHRNSWILPLNRVYTAIRRTGCVPLNLWSTKIHVVAHPEMSIKELKALAKTVIHHNHGFNSLAWQLRSKDVHSNAHSLVWIPNLSNLSGRRRRILDGLDSTQSVEGIAKLMNTDMSGKGHLRPWNFWPVVPAQTDPMSAPYYGGHQSTHLVEYNLAPGSATPEDAAMWIDLACLFVRGAIKHNARWPRGTAKGPDPNLFRESDLSKFVLEQAEEAGLSATEQARLRQRLAFLKEADTGT